MKREKIAARLLMAMEDFSLAGRDGVNSHFRTLGLVATEARAEPNVVVFIRCFGDAKLTHLADRGIQVNQSTGEIRTAFLPLTSVDVLSEDDGVRQIVPAHYLRPMLDVAVEKVHVAGLQTPQDEGQGVVIGTVDTGIDVNHPAFGGRIERIWDQTLSGRGVAEGRYGIELKPHNFASSLDAEGHGTHVAGIAASADPTYRGVAPGASIIAVKTDFQDAHIADGIRYIFRVAGDRPAVVNLSLGGHSDPHDGSDVLSELIDSESGPGRIVCCAAGNAGNDNIHASKVIPSGAMNTVRFRVPQSLVTLTELNAWYPGNGSLDVSLRTPSGLATPWQSAIPNADFVQSYSLPNARISIATPGPDPNNGAHNVLLQIKSFNTLPGGVWQLRVTNTGSDDTRLDVWALDDQDSATVTFTGRSVDDAMKIGSPGAAGRAITVASYTTKTEWKDVDGVDREIAMTLNDISDFSSEGPLRDGSEKPDVAAPGAWLVSCLSSDSSLPREFRLSDQFVAMQGTSMATPFVAGVVALLLKKHGKLSPEQIRAKLIASASIPGSPSGHFDAKWGFGLIDGRAL